MVNENFYSYPYKGFIISRARVKGRWKYSLWKGQKLVDIFTSSKKAREHADELKNNDL